MFTNVNQAFFDVGGGFKLHFIDMTKAMSGATLKELKVRRPDIVEKLKPWNTSKRKNCGNWQSCIFSIKKTF